MNTFGFGPSPASLAELEAQGADHWFEQQLHAPKHDPAWLQQKLWGLSIFHLSPWELRDWPQNDVLVQLQRAAIVRAVYSPFQVRERMVHFWSDHFSVFVKKGLGAHRKPMDERLVIRENALGRFHEMVQASAHSAAMLVFLDQQASTAAHPNENYARELLELHTLGVDGGYTQTDVMEVARCFTGWTEERGFLKANGRFKFDPSLHDDGTKTVLGHKIPAGGGVKDGLQVLDIVCSHPATASHIAKKLCRSMYGDEGSKIAGQVERSFSESKGDIKSILREAREAGKRLEPGTAIKRPFDLMIGAIRTLGGETDGGPSLQSHLAAMGQPLYQWPMPDGYPVDTGSWKSSLLARWNFAVALCHGRIQGTSIKTDVIADPVQAVFGSEYGRIARDLQGVADVRDQTALCLSSPEYQWK